MTRPGAREAAKGNLTPDVGDHSGLAGCHVGLTTPTLFVGGLCANSGEFYAAPPPRPGKSMLLASVRGNLGISAVARQTRRLFSPRGGVDRQDVWATADEGVIFEEGSVFVLWAARRKATRRG